LRGGKKARLDKWIIYVLCCDIYLQKELHLYYISITTLPTRWWWLYNYIFIPLLSHKWIINNI